MHTRSLLKLIGGQANIARLFGITESAVSQWVDENEIPNARSMYLRLKYPWAHWDKYDARSRDRACEEVSHG